MRWQLQSAPHEIALRIQHLDVRQTVLLLGVAPVTHQVHRHQIDFHLDRCCRARGNVDSLPRALPLAFDSHVELASGLDVHTHARRRIALA